MGLGGTSKPPAQPTQQEPSGWEELEKILLAHHSLPGNKGSLGGKSPNEVTAEEIADVKGIASSALVRRNFAGTKTFLRLVIKGRARDFSGEWWFDEELITSLGKPNSRSFLSDLERNHALCKMLREFLAIPEEWCRIDEIWVLDLPSGSALMGFSCEVRPPKLFGDLALNAKGNAKLVGRAQQVFFPVKNAAWVQRFRNSTR